METNTPSVWNAERLTAEAASFLAPQGLKVFGWFRTDKLLGGLLIGDVGGSQWQAFCQSPFAVDGQPDPMNRWTISVLSPLAEQLSAELRTPFGDKIWPFQRWAQQALGVQASPLGLFIHEQWGVWWALRGALVFEDMAAVPASAAMVHPCSTCVDKPCLATCPVGAFSSSGYDVEACRSHVNHAKGAQCRNAGCLARQACPVGQSFAYSAAQQAFHMRAFA